jgi:hypothetical protein
VGENARDEAPRAALEAERKELVARYESTVLAWVAEGDATQSREERRRARDEGAEGLRENYWRLDPYVRAKSLYDRIGLVPGAAAKQNAAPAPGTSADDLD